MKNNLKKIDEKLGKLIDAIHQNNIKEREQIINQIIKEGYEGLDIDKIERITNILDKIKQDIDTLDEKKKIKFISQLSNFKFSIDNVTKNVLKIILALFIIEIYLFGYLGTEKAAIIGGVLILVSTIGLYLYMYFFSNTLGNKKNKISTNEQLNKNTNNIIINENDNLDNIEIIENKNEIDYKISLSNQIIKIIIGGVWIKIAISIMNPLVAEHGFNGLMILINPGLWGLIVGPILIINALYNLIFYFLINILKLKEKKLIPIKNIIGLIVLAIIPGLYFIRGLKYTFYSGPFGGIVNFPFISLIILIIIFIKIKNNYKLKKELGKQKTYLKN